MFKILHTDGNARRGEFHTVHGVVQTPVFQNVGTIAAIKGAVSTMDLKEIGCQVELSNTYHLHLTAWRASQIYELGQTYFNGQRRFSGVFTCRFEKNNRRRRQL